ncbi:MAG: hypothetical protein EOM69_13510, partial [Clostridia bacterium]|nr:hypothetical protein [Clostridia bacterium]
DYTAQVLKTAGRQINCLGIDCYPQPRWIGPGRPAPGRETQLAERFADAAAVMRKYGAGKEIFVSEFGYFLDCDHLFRGEYPVIHANRLARSLLKAAVAEAADMGLSVRIASECEFYLFEANEKGEMTDVPHDRAGYLDVAPLDHSEDVRREICLTLERMNIRPESSHHERGPGQNEVDFHRADPLTAADQLIAFYNAVRTVASRYGLRASFLPKPIDDEAGNGMHVNLSLYRERENLFRLVNGKPGTEAGAAIAGLLNRLCGISLFLNPLPNSFDRLCDEAAPHRLCWSTAQDSSALCIPLPQDRFARIRLQTPDPTCNAYLAFALIIRAALY